jgi:hypothetical protein
MSLPIHYSSRFFYLRIWATDSPLQRARTQQQTINNLKNILNTVQHTCLLGRLHYYSKATCFDVQVGVTVQHKTRQYIFVNTHIDVLCYTHLNTAVTQWYGPYKYKHMFRLYLVSHLQAETCRLRIIL